MLKEILSTIVNGSYPAVDYAAHATFAKDSLPYLLRIIETVKTLFNVESDNGKQLSLLEKGYVLLSEGTDFTYEKVFETLHPYPRTDIPIKETIHVPKAIAFSVELDKRCQTENNQDYLLLQSADHAFWVNDSFGTYIKFYGKPAA